MLTTFQKSVYNEITNWAMIPKKYFHDCLRAKTKALSEKRRFFHYLLYFISNHRRQGNLIEVDFTAK